MKLLINETITLKDPEKLKELYTHKNRRSSANDQ